MRIAKILLVTAAILIVLNFFGFCFSKFTYLGTDKLIAIALDSQVKMDRDILPEGIKTATDLLSFKPNCCSVSQYPRGDILLRLLGCRQYMVSVGYIVTTNGKDTESSSSFYVDHCGKILEVETLRAPYPS